MGREGGVGYPLGLLLTYHRMCTRKDKYILVPSRPLGTKEVLVDRLMCQFHRGTIHAICSVYYVRLYMILYIYTCVTEFGVHLFV